MGMGIEEVEARNGFVERLPPRPDDVVGLHAVRNLGVSPRRSARRGRFAEMPDDRLTGLDAQFLHVEDESTHMHVAAVFMFDGDPPEYEDFLEGVRSRLHLVPRYRQKLAFVPFN